MGSFLLLVNYIVQTVLVTVSGMDANIAILSLLFLNGAFIVRRLDKIVKKLEEK